MFAVLIAAPLFQTVRDEGAWRFPYRRLHSHAWTDAVIGVASLFFTGVSFTLAWLIAGLFDVIGIKFIKDLLKEEWFGWMLGGFAFGAAVGLLRERDRLVATLQRLVMVVFSVLAPVLAAALILFLLSIPFTGLAKLWDSWVSAAALLLVASAGAVLLANAVIGDGRDERSASRLLHWSALALIAAVLPLACLAVAAMGIRIHQYGWTPERLWGVIAAGIAITYGAAGWWAIWRGRRSFDDELRPMQTALAIVVCGLALVLALPIVDFGAMSARSQVARLTRGQISPARFDWAAMAFDFGPAGRARLAEIKRSGPAAWRSFATDALASKDRWRTAEAVRIADQAETDLGAIRPLSPDIKIDDDLKRRLAADYLCPKKSICALLRVDASRIAVITSRGEERRLSSALIDLSKPIRDHMDVTTNQQPVGIDLGSARIEIRQEPRRRVYVDGKPVGDIFE
jgi:hypothetical protein